MKTLVIDTSNRYLVVGAFLDEQKGVIVQSDGGQKQSEYAIPTISKVCEQVHVELLDFDEIVVTCGPGSYTGSRVGLTIAKTLKTVYPSISCKMVSSLQAYAGVEGKKIAILDARSKKMYVGIYNQGKLVEDEKLVEVSEFPNIRALYSEYEVVGQTSLIGLEEQEVDLASNIYEISKQINAVSSVHELLPRYIKEVEAKKICER